MEDFIIGFDKDDDEINQQLINDLRIDCIDVIEIQQEIQNLTNDITENLFEGYEKKFDQLKKENCLTELVKSKNDELIRKFLNRCMIKCIKERKLDAMLAVTIILPDLVAKSYKKPVVDLMRQLTYLEVPSIWYQRTEKKKLNIISENENFWPYMLPNPKSLFQFVYALFFSMHVSVVSLTAC